LGKEWRSWSSSLWSFLHSPVTSSLLGPSVLLNSLFLPQCQRPSSTRSLGNRYRYIPHNNFGEEKL
jgi:hypothetical protein